MLLFLAQQVSMFVPSSYVPSSSIPSASVISPYLVVSDAPAPEAVPIIGRCGLVVPDYDRGWIEMV